MSPTSIQYPPKQTVEVHRGIIFDPDLNVSAKAIYVAVLFQRHTSTSQLSRLLHVNRETVAVHLKELVQKDWITRVGRDISPAQHKEISNHKIRWFRTRRALVPYLGEFVSFCWLDELIDSTDYIDHARPSFLRNPVTGQPMEYDRMYPLHRKAFEHQGLQHFRPTEKYPDEKKVREQELRDLAKMGLSVINGIQLTTITWKDLSLKGMSARIPDGLPRRSVDPEDPYIRYLEQESERYRTRMCRILDRQPDDEQ